MDFGLVRETKMLSSGGIERTLPLRQLHNVLLRMPIQERPVG